MQFLSLCGGDPARAASPNTSEEVCGFPKEAMIPSRPALSISYGDARGIFERLGGAPAPPAFRGALPRYSLGPSSLKFRLSVETYVCSSSKLE